MQSRKISQARRDVKFLDAVVAEIQAARVNHKGNAVMTLALVEQVGKLCQSLLHRRIGKADDAKVKHLSVTVAAMAMRVATEGDSSVSEFEPD